MADLLQSELIKLRAMEPEDIEILYRWENDTDIWKVSNTIAPFSKYVLRQFIENQSRDIYETRQLRLIIESRTSGTPVGAIDLFDLDPYNLRAGVGILIYDKNDQKRGFASEAVALLIRLLFPDTGTQPALLQYTGRQHRQPGSVQKQRVPGNRTEERVDQNHIGLAG